MTASSFTPRAYAPEGRKAISYQIAMKRTILTLLVAVGLIGSASAQKASPTPTKGGTGGLLSGDGGAGGSAGFGAAWYPPRTDSLISPADDKTVVYVQTGADAPATIRWQGTVSSASSKITFTSDASKDSAESRVIMDNQPATAKNVQNVAFSLQINLDKKTKERVLSISELDSNGSFIASHAFRVVLVSPPTPLKELTRQAGSFDSDGAFRKLQIVAQGDTFKVTLPFSAESNWLDITPPVSAKAVPAVVDTIRPFVSPSKGKAGDASISYFAYKRGYSDQVFLKVWDGRAGVAFEELHFNQYITKPYLLEGAGFLPIRPIDWEAGIAIIAVPVEWTSNGSGNFSITAASQSFVAERYLTNLDSTKVYYIIKGFVFNDKMTVTAASGQQLNFVFTEPDSVSAQGNITVNITSYPYTEYVNNPPGSSNTYYFNYNGVPITSIVQKSGPSTLSISGNRITVLGSTKVGKYTLQMNGSSSNIVYFYVNGEFSVY
jgi:hypothetical protein